MIQLEDYNLEPTLFPDNSSQVWKIPEKYLNRKEVTVRWDWLDEGEFIHLAQLKALLDQTVDRVKLELSYLPYARQDKPIGNNATFALYVFAQMLNSLKFNEVTIMDPHSALALELIDYSKAVYPIAEMHAVFDETDSDLVCYPDHGALVKYTNIKGYSEMPYIFGEKKREQATGKILSYNIDLMDTGKIAGKNVLVIDDICDGGATFVLLAKSLYDAGAKKVILFVTHGIFSRGLRPLREAGIKRIFTKDGEVTRELTAHMV